MYRKLFEMLSRPLPDTIEEQPVPLAPLPRLQYLWEYFSSFYERLLNASCLQDPHILQHEAISASILEISEILRLEGL